MKIVILADDDIINGKLRTRGEVVAVPDGYTNVRRVIRQQSKESASRITEEFFVIGLRKLQSILQADYPQFWQALERRPQVQQAIIQELREQPKFLQRALKEPQWFVDTVTKRFADAK